VLASTKDVLLDFDGPICSVFSGYTNAAVTEELRTRLGLVLAPQTNDPFDILKHAAESGPDIAESAEAELTRLELLAVKTAAPTPGAADVIRAFSAAGRRIVVVSNNSAAAVDAYARQHDLERFLTGISARTSSDPQLLKPSPHLVLEAVALLDAEPGRCLMIGDSPSDLEAARLAGVPSVGYANKLGKAERLASVKSDVIIRHISELLHQSQQIN
jgi:HAD superfamily hydrolase (TIGR01509 family)